MATKDSFKTEEVGTGTHRPLQIIPYAEKDADWFKANIDSCIMRCLFYGNKAVNKNPLRPLERDVNILYDAYNSIFPLDWFAHITDPLSAKDEKNKNFPAKVRPVTILRTNIDLLLGEYPRRPFLYSIKNMGQDGYSAYQEGLAKQIQDNFTQHFYQGVIQQEEANGRKLSPQEEQQLQQQVPLPEEVQKQFQSSYLDLIAIKAQKWVNRQVERIELRRKLHKNFKHWLIAGEAYSYKGIEHNSLVYRIVSPLAIDYDKSEDNDFVEDGEWVVARYLWTTSDVVDLFYEDLSTQDQKDLDQKYKFDTPSSFYDKLNGLYQGSQRNKVPVYHVQWKGKKKIGFLSYLDPETFQLVEEVVDENYVLDKDKGEKVEWKWVNEIYEGWRIGTDLSAGPIYPRYGALPVQRNEMNNHSSCKLSYNGRKYSDLHSQNMSILELGLPFQIMYIIITYILEKTIAKSKGKIFLFDHNSIPKKMGEEKFFYYCEALGYAALDRTQIGVDKSWNQYTVVDMSLFDQIEQLIKLQEYFKQQWDDMLGIARQRKGETYSSDGQGVNERAVFQSTVITDMIFIPFEEFQQRELQGIMDHAKFLTAKGERSIIEDDDIGTMIMEIFPEDFALAELGVFMTNATEEKNKLDQAKNMATAMLQNKVKTSQVLEVIDSTNMADLKQKVKELEAIETQLVQQQAQTQQEAQAAVEEMKEKYLKLGKLLDREKMEAEYDRKEIIEEIKIAGEIAALDRDNTEADTATAFSVADAIAHKKVNFDMAAKTEQLSQSRTKLQSDIKESEHGIQMDKKNHELAKQKLKIDRKKANQRPKK